MPSFKLADFLVSGIKGPKKIQNVILGTNPMRISFRGKEIVICRYDYFKKIKKNHIPRLAEKQGDSQKPDSFKIVKTVLHQGSLMPLSPIVQPVMWSYADSLIMYPEPDYLILADNTEEYSYKIPLDAALKDEAEDKEVRESKEERFVTVFNPGVFG